MQEQKKEMKIGILLTRPKSEQKKDEVISIKSKKRPWAKLALKKHTIAKKVPGDVLVGCYLEHKYPNVSVDYIRPEEITAKRLKKNDLNFMIIYDLLEAFHVDGKRHAEKLTEILKNANNVYPPFKYQQFVYNKCNYYTYLSGKRLQVVPSYCLRKEKWDSKTMSERKKYTQEIIDRLKNNKWEKYIAKPVFGQESKDFKKFNSLSYIVLYRYLSKMFKKYPGVILQEYIKGFDKENPEVRMYFVGNDYKYSIITTNTKVWELGKKKKIKGIGKYKHLANRTLRVLPKMKVNKITLPRLLTRIDVASGLEGKRSHFINEIEFVPSLYIQDHKHLIDKMLGDQIYKIMKIYKTRSR